jgi:hypothetical protein
MGHRQMAVDVLRQLRSVEADAIDEVRPSATQKIQAQDIEPGRRRDAAVVANLSGHI